jgi:hypothetical protein
MVEIRIIKGVFINYYNDSVLGLTYGKILTEECLESVRFPTLLENYKHKHLVEPNCIVEIEVIKTRKNWIVKEVISSNSIYSPCDFQDYVNMCEVIKLTRDNIIDEQRTGFLSHFINYFQNIAKVEVRQFDNLLQTQMGFR